MRTNRYCPMYNRYVPDRPVALTEEQEEDMERKLFQDSQDLVKVEGTKITLSKDLIKKFVFFLKTGRSNLSISKRKGVACSGTNHKLTKSSSSSNSFVIPKIILDKVDFLRRKKTCCAASCLNMN